MKKRFFNSLICIIMIFVMLPFSLSAVFATEDTAEDAAFDAAAAVMDKINEIGNVTMYSGNKIREARTAYDELPDSDKDCVENLSILTDAESALLRLYAEVADTDHAATYEATGQYIEGLGTPTVGSVGGEWMVICLTRSGRACPDGYYENAAGYIQENINDSEQLHKAKSTDNARVILALTAAGYDVTDVDGHNLLRGLSDMNYLKKQGLNGPIWALIAFDSYAYELPQNENEDAQATREGIISYILEKQISDGGWSIYGKIADPDMTGMAIQALAPYYNTNPDVAAAVERALDCLSAIQHENGGFGSIDGSCSESCAQVIVALTALGIDPEADARFVKNGVSVLDALCMFAIDEGGFAHIQNGGLNGMATEQGYYALASYFRFLAGETSLYDMTDVEIYIEEDPNGSEAIEDSADTEDTEHFEDTEYSEENEYFEDTEYTEDSEYSEDTEYTEDYDADASENDYDEPEDSLPTEGDITEEEVVEEAEVTEKIIFTENTFADVTKDAWYYEAVKYVYENDIMQGTSNGFEPEGEMTRAMLVTVLYKWENPENTENAHSFTDVPKGEWYSDAVMWAAEKNIVNGVSENKFAPDKAVTREQMALILYRYAKMQGYDVNVKADIPCFTDMEDVSDWALDATLWANSVSLVSGTSKTTLSPKDTATRAQVATILMRFCETISK